MFDPITTAVVLAFVAGISGTTTVFKWEDINYALRGKRIGILGDKAVGKTTLFNYLRDGKKPENYIQTLKDTLDKKEIINNFEGLGVNILFRKTTDISGSEDFYPAWKEIFLNSDIIFYLFRTDFLLNGNSKAIERIEADLQQITGWIESYNSWQTLLNKTVQKKWFFIVGNHWIDDRDYQMVGSKNQSDYIDKVVEKTVIKNQRQKIMDTISKCRFVKYQVKLVLGSLATSNDMDILLKKVFEIVLEK
ncbi:hypothetical protein ACE1CI_21100 [Aerosakkonemataceae cyanobacterium BLCC-F50]|uniref:Uncharacterized protein n=1 Tax=Floridaenema flaviceps BLCC-F50 TaxID=3153642 RepID=A0ABV4XUL1_9CYAN